MLAAIQKFDALPDSAFIRAPVVVGLLGISEPTLWRWAREGRIPRPVKLSRGVSVWRVSDIRKVLAEGAGGAT